MPKEWLTVKLQPCQGGEGAVLRGGVSRRGVRLMSLGVNTCPECRCMGICVNTVRGLVFCTQDLNYCRTI